MAKPAANTGKDSTARTVSIISLCLSASSLCLSAVALWYSSLAPPDIKAIVSRPVFWWQGSTKIPPGMDIPGAKISTEMLLMKATCAFSNNGAHTGEINQLAIQFESDDGKTNWTASPRWIIDEAKFSTEKGIAAWTRGQFAPIVLPGKQTISYSYLFIVEPSSKEKVILAPHRFHVRLFTWSSGDTQPRKQQESTLDMNENVVNVLSTGQFTELPFEEERSEIQTILQK